MIKKMLNKTKEELLTLFGRSEIKLKAINSSVLDTISSTGFKVIEDHIKASIDNEYKTLLTLPKERLEETQIKIQVMLDLMTSIYGMSGQVWNYDGVRDPAKLMQNEDEKLSAYEKAQQEYNSYLNEISNQKGEM